MSDLTVPVPGPLPSRAAGRSIGAIFLAVFGGAWLTLALYAFGRLNWPSFALLLAFVAFAVALSLRLLARAKPAADREPPDSQRERDNRTFAWINAGQGLAIFLLFFFLSPRHQQDFAFAAAVVVVGLHFLVMPPTYRYRSNFVLGIAMTVWGLLCMLLLRGDRLIAFAAVGAGLMLWSQAAFALHTASSIVRRLGLENK